MKNIGVLGAGTWGTALARMLHNSGHRVCMWSALEQEVDELSTTRTHPNLPGMQIPPQIRFTKNIADACRGQDIILFAVPSPFVRATAKKAAPYITGGQVIADVAKGIEADTLMTMSQIIAQELGDLQIEPVALSGPTHAEEVARDLPTTIVAACSDLSLAQQVQEVFSSPCMRVYTNDDVLGVELCGAIKNVMALATGIAAGLGCGDNTKAALITRGLSEIMQLGLAMGCKMQTFSGLAGVGDLIVTTTSMHSRNNRCGMLIGKGVKVDDAVAQIGMVVEGLHALPAAMALSKKYHVEMPIVETVHRIVCGQITPNEAVSLLMMREQKSEYTFRSVNRA
ncbi:MAG: NAD(P)-dependent glycerol-3-phosphate dehydrogenase [Oscillospiraceae bacterium]|nr:NAD(P)-dependent glycerol-3-phosphate dehydrogenase [Oscillospiraceae bacterium]